MVKIIHPTHFYIVQSFGENLNRFYKELGLPGHNGIDYATPTGSLALAPCDMEITVATFEPGGGNTIKGRSFEHWFVDGQEYALEVTLLHLRDFISKVGDQVPMGYPVAHTNNTGKYTTGPHLHMGTRIVKKVGSQWKSDNSENGYNGFVDPMQFITKSLQNLPIRLFKDNKTSAVYWLGLNSEFVEINDEAIVKRFVGDWKDITIYTLPVELPYSPSKVVVATLSKFFQVFLNRK